MTTDNQSGISDQHLQKMIKLYPLALRRELMQLIEKLELALAHTGLEKVTWIEALTSYRTFKFTGNPAFLGLMGSLASTYARDIDAAFMRMKIEPSEWLCEPVLKAAKSKDQGSKADLATAKREEAAKTAQLNRSRVAKAAISKMTIDPASKTLNEIYTALETEWYADWAIQYPKADASKCPKSPSRNTWRKSVKAILPEHPSFAKSRK